MRRALLRLPNQRLDNLHSSLKLCPIFLSRLHRALAASTTVGATVHPREVAGPKRDACVQLVDVLAAYRRLGRDSLQDIVKLIDERDGLDVGCRERFGRSVLQRRCPICTHRSGNLQIGALRRSHYREDRVRGRWGEPASNACGKYRRHYRM